MRVFSYIIDHDVGFAPNPFFGICTLAACKPTIRRTAQKGDFLVGTGARGWSKKMVYWAKITEIITYDQYWRSTKFSNKKAVMNGSLMQCYGDNIYHADAAGQIIQEDSFHSQVGGIVSEANFERDVGRTDRILICDDFLYLGKSAINLPEALSEVVHTTQGHKCNFEESLKKNVIQWLTSLKQRGWIDDPIDWP